MKRSKPLPGPNLLISHLTQIGEPNTYVRRFVGIDNTSSSAKVLEVIHDVVNDV